MHNNVILLALSHAEGSEAKDLSVDAGGGAA